MIYTMLILAGICLYACINHALIGMDRPISIVHLLFSMLCAVLVAYELLHLRTYTVSTPPEYLFSFKSEISVILIFFGLFPWFISQYSTIRPKWLLEGFSLLALTLIIINITQPYSLQFSAPISLEQEILPWGETIARPVGQISPWFFAGVALAISIFIFNTYALTVLFLKERTYTNLAMLVAIAIFFLMTIEAILVRYGVLHFISLGHLSMLCMIAAMSLVLNYDLRQKLETMVESRTAELHAAIKELESFSYSVSHDLRAPLRSIDGFSQALLEDYSNLLDNDGKQYLGRIRVNAQHMSTLIEDMLKLSRISRKQVKKMPVNLSHLVEQSIKRLQELEPERGVEYKIAENIFASGDKDLLAIAIDNLTSNAWKYTGKTAHPIIEFGIEKKGKQTTYHVIDNGAGFDMKYSDKLFSAFQRLHSDDEFFGSGIGLTIVARVINRHGGKIWANSQPNKGAAFYFNLPN